MRPSAEHVTSRFFRLGGMLALLLVIAMLATLAPAQDAKSPPNTDQTKSGKRTDDSPKKDETKTPPVKLGLSINDPRALQGYTLISPFVSPNTYLLDMSGRVVRTWESDCSPALCAYLLENGHLLRPGSIGGDARVFGPGPGVGGRIQEFTFEGELVWDFKFYNSRQLPHHDMTPLPNGNVLLVVWDRKTTEEAIAAGRRPEMAGDKHFLPDSLVEIKPTGKTTGEIVWEWHLWDHLVQDFDKGKKNFGNVAHHPELVNINYGEEDLPKTKAGQDGKDKSATNPVVTDGKDNAKADPKKDNNQTANRPFRVDPDFTHFNAVAYNAELDQVMVSVWKFSEFWIIDHSTTTAEAASHHGGRSGKGGDLLYRWGNPRAYRAGTKADQKLFTQHNAHWIPKGLPGAGHILLFNNGVDRPDGSYSSADEIQLPVDSQGHYSYQPGTAFGPDRALWSYSAPKKEDFYSSFISGAQRLANGNTLICSGASGTVFEVTHDKETVWKFINPAKGGPMQFGPLPRVGQIMSPIAAEMLDVSSAQQKPLHEIQKDIDAHLDKLLTDQQKKQTTERSGDGGFGSGEPGQIMSSGEQNRLKLTDDQKKDLASLQKTVSDRFDKVLTDAQRKQIKSVFAPFVPPARVTAGGNADGLQPGKILSAAQQNTLNLSPQQKSRIAEIQKEIDAQLETLLTEDQKKQLQSMQQAPIIAKTAGPVGPGRGPVGGSPLFRAYRYSSDFPGLVGKNLAPGKLFEDLQPKEPEKKDSKEKK